MRLLLELNQVHTNIIHLVFLFASKINKEVQNKYK